MPRELRSSSGSRVEEFGVRSKTTLKNGKGCKSKESMVTLRGFDRKFNFSGKATK